MADISEDIPPEFYELVGRAASDWASLELLVNDCIWALSGTPWGAGACVTAQIYALDGRMRALVALLKLRRANELAKKVNSFHEKSRCASELLSTRQPRLGEAFGSCAAELQF